MQKATKPMSPSMRTPAITPIAAVPAEPIPPLLPALFVVCGASKGELLFGKIGGDGTVVCGPGEGGDGDT